MVATAFRPVDIGQDLPITLIALVAFYLILAVLLAWHILKTTRRQNKGTKLYREWYENGTAISNWLKDHYNELNLDKEATIYHPEFQELLWKDFGIYEKLIILDPKLKEDPITNVGRAFYGSLIRAESQKPS